MTALLDRARWPALAVIAAAMLLAYRASGGAADGDYMLTLVLVAVAGLVFGLARPRAMALCTVVAGATVLPERFGEVSFGGIRTDLLEAMAFLTIGVWLLYLLLGQVPRSSFVLPLLLLQVGHVIGLVIASANGSTRESLLGFGKAFAIYLLPLVFTAFFATLAQQDLLERWLLRLCTWGSVITLLAAAGGVSLGGTSRTRLVETLDQTFRATRIRTPLVPLVVVATLLIFARMLDHGFRTPDVARITLYLTTIVLSFNRSTWVPMALALLLLGVLRQGRGRETGRGLRILLVGAVVMSGAYVAASAGALGRTASVAANRVVSTVDTKVTKEKSYLDRASENEDAFRSLGRSPLVGVGAGRPYGAVRAIYFDNPPRLVYVERPFIHNSYLGAWLQIGLVGLLGFVLLGVGVAREAVAAARDRGLHASRNIAAGLAMLVFGLGAFLQTALFDRGIIIAVSCSLALLQRPRAEPDPPPTEVWGLGGQRVTSSIASRTAAAK